MELHYLPAHVFECVAHAEDQFVFTPCHHQLAVCTTLTSCPLISLNMQRKINKTRLASMLMIAKLLRYFASFSSFR